MKISNLFFAIFLTLSCYSATSESYSQANLSTTWTTHYSAVKPMLVRRTNATALTCGFSCEGGDCTSYIFTINISGSYEVLNSEVVWSANRDHPVGNNAILNFTSAGELVLRDGDGTIVWTTNTAGKSVVGMNLTDYGNLVLFDDQNLAVWQSFDHPTDSLLHGQKLFIGQILKSSVSFTNYSGQEGMYSLHVTNEGLFAYVESNPPQNYYMRSISPYDNATTKGRLYLTFLNGRFSPVFYSSESSDPDEVSLIPKAQYMKLMPDGHLGVFKPQLPLGNNWSMVSDLFTDDYLGECDYPLVCGRNSICSTGQLCRCVVFEYFRPVNDRNLNLGCSEITPLICNSTQDQHFITLKNVAYFTSPADMEEVSLDTCKQACQSNCSCKAAFFHYFSSTSYGECFLPSEIFTMKRIGGESYFNAISFIKVQNVGSRPRPLFQQVVSSKNRSSHQVATAIGSTIGSFLLVMAIGFITYIVHKRKKGSEMEERYLDQVPGMPNWFSYDELKTSTENFSKKLGKGGYGSVFEGTLIDGTKIAVKCLEGLAHVKKSFLAEVQSIGSIHHVNLVRLRGFCTWKLQHFLVYDFMSNGSLDKWIYHGNREHVLEWECRKKIILDVAKGLSYLHEECRQKIVHLDIKPQNILLDNDFTAKVSDFGLSKLIDKTQTEVMSTIKGTPGYIAPEWRTSIITEKLDVYSFGIVLLEILCGRKVFDRSLSEESWYLLFVFQKCWEQGTLLDIVDQHSADMQEHSTEVVEMMKVASWCLQANFKRRPSMSSVVKVLEGVMHVESNLDYNFTDPRIQEAEEDAKDFTRLSSSLLSGPR